MKTELDFCGLMREAQTFAQVLGLFEQMKSKGIEATEASYDQIIYKAENFLQAQIVLEEMKSQASKITPTVLVYNIIIKLSPDYKTAKGFFDEMKKAGLSPDEYTYNSLIGQIDTIDAARSYYYGFKQKFPYQKGVVRLEKNYNYLFGGLFKKVRFKHHWDFLKREIALLDLDLHEKNKAFYDSLEKRFLNWVDKYKDVKPNENKSTETRKSTFKNTAPKEEKA